MRGGQHLLLLSPDILAASAKPLKKKERMAQKNKEQIRTNVLLFSNLSGGAN